MTEPGVVQPDGPRAKQRPDMMSSEPVPEDRGDQPRYRCEGCGKTFTRAEVWPDAPTGAFAHTIPGSMPDYCGPVRGDEPAALDRLAAHGVIYMDRYGNPTADERSIVEEVMHEADVNDLSTEECIIRALRLRAIEREGHSQAVPGDGSHEDLLRGLLARIFRDGGHRTDTFVSLADAAEAADLIVAELNALSDEAEREGRSGDALEAALQRIVDFEDLPSREYDAKYGGESLASHERSEEAEIARRALAAARTAVAAPQDIEAAMKGCTCATAGVAIANGLLLKSHAPHCALAVAAEGEQ